MIPSTLTKRLALTAALAALGGATYFYARPSHPPADGTPACCAGEDEDSDTSAPTGEVTDLSRPLSIPDTKLIDQSGRKVRFYSDLVRGRVVAINFIFTTCKGVCPPMGATFGKLGQELRGAQLISVSVDPVNDTPARLAEWARAVGASPGWSLLTGTKQDVDGLLKALGVFSADKANHSPFILLGNDRTGTWRRVHGLSPIETIRSALASVRDERRGAAKQVPDSPAHRYFTDVALVNQDGESLRLYSDLIHGKVVLIHAFFASCRDTCPQMLATCQRLQEHLGDRLGRDVHLLSITVDPDNDSRQVLKDLAQKLNARRGWHLLSGPKQDVEFALRKLGLAAAQREAHSNLFILGNDSTHLWKKVRGLSPAAQIAEILDGVIADKGATTPHSPRTPAEAAD
jgi:cytochrome oxidase Cu insertion factor (SCO1/SenC/PrrC family)